MESVREQKRKQRRARRMADNVLREQMERARERMETVRHQQEDVDVRSHNALVMSLMPRIQSVVDAWCRKQVPMKVEFPASRFRAYTDFQSITMEIPQTQVSVDFAGDLRGLAYHEAGHILKTVPLPDLAIAMFPPDESVPSWEATHLDHVWRFCAKVWGLDQYTVQRAWNLLEDQRMETAMVRDSVILADYYNVIVLSHVINDPSNMKTAWLYLIGREHVDEDVCVAAREMMCQAHGEAKVLQAEALVDAYMAATTMEDLWAPIIPFALLMQETGSSADALDEHNFAPANDLSDEELEDLAEKILDGAIPPAPPSESKGEGTPAPMPSEAGDDDEGEGDEPGQGEAGDDDDGDDEGAGDDEGDDEGDEPGQGGSKGDSKDADEGDPGQAAGTKPGDFAKRLGDALQKAKEKRATDERLTSDVKAYNEAFQDARSGAPLRRVIVTNQPDPERQHMAIQVNQMLRAIYEQARAETAPSWQQGQRRGVLDVIRYKTRQPGDMEFYRNYAEGGDLHLPNLAVSIVLDGSGSMHGYERDLGMAAFAMKSACDVFSIPCTVTLYDTEGYLLWDAEDRPHVMPTDFIPAGGTDPYEALQMIDGQAHDKAHHLVIIMTDGIWDSGWTGGGRHSLAHYQAPNRDIVVLFWNTPVVPLSGIETTKHQRLNSLMDMPAILRPYILASL